jgi:hypothetical protein
MKRISLTPLRRKSSSFTSTQPSHQSRQSQEMHHPHITFQRVGMAHLFGDDHVASFHNSPRLVLLVELGILD